MQKTKLIKNGTIKKIVTICSLIILTLMPITNCLAVDLEKIDLKSDGECGKLLKYKGMEVKVTYVYYEKEGIRYPAYCMDKTKPGVTEDNEYFVSISDRIHDVNLWRYVVNGYPYKTYQELGCQNEKEAFAATKQAIYCYIHGNDVNLYEGIGEAGERTVKALRKIVSDAKSMKDVQDSNIIDINKKDSSFNQDEIEKGYVSKIYEVKSRASSLKYMVSIIQENEKEIEGIKITDLKNNVKKEFFPGEKFKVLIPIERLTKQGNFKIKIDSKVKTKPVYYGKTSKPGYQDYALTAATYEDSNIIINEEYFENKSDIKIIKLDKETKEKIEGVEFQILDENKKVKYSNLITDKNGEIYIKHMLPGTYYLLETKEKEGYVKNPNVIKIDINLNEKVEVKINNLKEEKAKVKVNEKEVEATVEKTSKEIEANKYTKIVKKLPVTGM